MPNRPIKTPTKKTADAMPPSGLVGIFDTLAAQHAEVSNLFGQLRTKPASRAMLWPQIRRALVSHEHGEIRELYPVLRQFPQTRALADHHDEEARNLDALIARLDAEDIRTDAWLALFEQLVTTVLHHAKDEEEAKIFPLAQQVLGEARAIELDAKYLATQEKLVESN